MSGQELLPGIVLLLDDGRSAQLCEVNPFDVTLCCQGEFYKILRTRFYEQIGHNGKEWTLQEMWLQP